MYKHADPRGGTFSGPFSLSTMTKDCTDQQSSQDFPPTRRDVILMAPSCGQKKLLQRGPAPPHPLEVWSCLSSNLIEGHFILCESLCPHAPYPLSCGLVTFTLCQLPPPWLQLDQGWVTEETLSSFVEMVHSCLLSLCWEAWHPTTMLWRPASPHPSQRPTIVYGSLSESLMPFYEIRQWTLPGLW